MIIDIVLVYGTGRGGVEDVITTTTNELTKRGHFVRVFQAYSPEYIEWESTVPAMYYYGLKEGLENENLETLAEGYQRKLQELGKPDIILATHAPSLSYICRLAISNIHGNIPPILSWIHGLPEYYGNENLLKYSDGHLAISTVIGEKIKQNIYPGVPVYYIGNPVVFDHYKRIRQSKDNLDLIYVGRLSQHDKKIDILLKALKNLQEGWSLTIFGNGPDEEYLKELANEFKINGNITWKGWQEHPWEVINKATSLVLTSNNEAFGLVLVEALGRGIPVITTEGSGPTDIVKDGQNGWVFPIDDYKKLNSILSDIGKGNLRLPSPDSCEKSVQKFDYQKVIGNIELILGYHAKLEQSGEYKEDVTDIGDYIIKESNYYNSKFVIPLYTTVINGVENLGSSNKGSLLQEYFTDSFLDVIDQDDYETEVTANVCYPKINHINYKMSKATVSFILVNKFYDGDQYFYEGLKCKVKVVNDNGLWKINELICKEKDNKQCIIPDRRLKILLVKTNSSGSNSEALYRNCPAYIRDLYDVELINDEPHRDEYLNKVKTSDILILNEANIHLDKNLYNPNQIIIDTWHGHPFKTGGYADKNERFQNSISNRWNQIDYLCTYSELSGEFMRNCFQFDPQIVTITGAPRNDIMLKSKVEIAYSYLGSMFKKDFKDKKVIFYMPTYRQFLFHGRCDSNKDNSNVFGINNFNEQHFLDFLEKHNIELVVKLHPAEEELFQKQNPDSLKNINLLTDKLLANHQVDLYEILVACDLLITDYSGISLDYLLLNRPIIYLPVDIEEYRDNRGILLEPYNEWTPGPKVYSQEEMQKEIIKSFNEPAYYQEERKGISDIVHTYSDGESSNRVWRFVNSILENKTVKKD